MLCWVSPERWGGVLLSVWPSLMVQILVVLLFISPYNQSTGPTQRGRDEAVIPGGYHTQAEPCNLQNYTNLGWNWLNRQIRLVFQHQPETCSNERTCKAHANRAKACDARSLSEVPDHDADKQSHVSVRVCARIFKRFGVPVKFHANLQKCDLATLQLRHHSFETVPVWSRLAQTLVITSHRLETAGSI